MPLRKLPFRSVVVTSIDDPYVTLEHAEFFAHSWESHLIKIAVAGHINPHPVTDHGQTVNNGLRNFARFARSTDNLATRNRELVTSVQWLPSKTLPGSRRVASASSRPRQSRTILPLS